MNEKFLTSMGFNYKETMQNFENDLESINEFMMVLCDYRNCCEVIRGSLREENKAVARDILRDLEIMFTNLKHDEIRTIVTRLYEWYKAEEYGMIIEHLEELDERLNQICPQIEMLFEDTI